VIYTLTERAVPRANELDHRKNRFSFSRFSQFFAEREESDIGHFRGTKNFVHKLATGRKKTVNAHDRSN